MITASMVGESVVGGSVGKWLVVGWSVDLIKPNAIGANERSKKCICHQ